MSSNPTSNSVQTKLVFTGLEGFYKVIEGLSLEMQTVILKEGVTQAVKPLVRLAKQYAPKRTGALAASISSKVIPMRKTGTAVAIMGPAKGRFSGGKMLKKGESAADSDQPSRYAHLVEFGHLTPKGRVAAKPFMRPATAVGAEEVSRAMVIGISSGLNKAVKKYMKDTF